MGSAHSQNTGSVEEGPTHTNPERRSQKRSIVRTELERKRSHLSFLVFPGVQEVEEVEGSEQEHWANRMRGTRSFLLLSLSHTQVLRSLLFHLAQQ
jgi:Ni,Fe-hydrogenase III large subunit